MRALTVAGAPATPTTHASHDCVLVAFPMIASYCDSEEDFACSCNSQTATVSSTPKTSRKTSKVTFGGEQVIVIAPRELSCAQALTGRGEQCQQLQAATTSTSSRSPRSGARTATDAQSPVSWIRSIRHRLQHFLCESVKPLVARVPHMWHYRLLQPTALGSDAAEQ